jgi:hypothetical protein
VILPIILPVIEVTLLLGFVFTVKVFDLVIGLTGGGPANATQLITTWSYNLSFQVFSFGEGAALNNVLLVLALIAAPVYLWLSRDSLRRSRGADTAACEVEGPAMALHSRGHCPPVIVPGIRDHRRLVRSTGLFSGTFYCCHRGDAAIEPSWGPRRRIPRKR